ncbi:MAG: hypothetical protein J5J06_07160 [Phycisphaerae bacterium]|nr:hypothetical protein [Phycisphaerae bacterium]
MTTASTLLLLTLILSPLQTEQAKGDSGERDAAAVALLQNSAEAMKKSEVVRYDVELRASGWLKEFVPDVEGTVTIGNQSKWEIDRFHCRVRIMDKDGKTTEREAGSNGDVYFLVDPDTKTAYEDMDPLVLGPDSRAIQRAVMSAFASPEPFKEELSSKSITLGKPEEIAGVQCDRVDVAIQGRKDSWYIARSDSLPRRVVRLIVREGNEGTIDMTLRSLVVDPQLDRDPFTLRVPEGYRKTNEFPE